MSVALLSKLGMAALELSQEQGYAVFPVHTVSSDHCSCGLPAAKRSDDDKHAPGKHPRTPHGCRDASRHPEAVADWWDAWPNANIGIATGAASNVVVVDVDGAEGERSLAALGSIPPTVAAHSGREDGGRHLYFAHPGERIPNSQGRLGARLDVRGDGGYIIAPPSLHPSGRRYTWARGLSPWDLDPAPLPSRLREQLLLADDRAAVYLEGRASLSHETVLRSLVRNAWTVADAVDQADRRVRAYLARVGSHAVGSRNGAAFQVAAWLLRDFGLPPRAAEAYLIEWNAGNRPPLGARELRAVFDSATRHARRPVGCAHNERETAA